MIGESCIIVNRTSRVLTVVKDGVSRKFQPGENQATTDWIKFCKNQHPMMGSFAPDGFTGTYLMGVKGIKGIPDEDCSLIPPGAETSGVEKFDRAQFDDPEAKQAVPMNSGMPRNFRRVPSEMSPLPEDTNHFGRGGRE